MARVQAPPLPRSSPGARLRAALRPRRRLRLRRSGLALIAGVFGLGVATLNTGNNLLYLLVGALLGLILLSGWLSEHAISGIRLGRQLPFRATAGEPVRIEYRVQNRKRRLPSAGLELRDVQLARGNVRVRPEVLEPAALALILAGESAAGAEVLSFPRRGLYRFERLVLATSYPFGLFTKERDLSLPGTLVVWPRYDHEVGLRSLGAGSSQSFWRDASSTALASSGRGEYRGLRSYRPGDDPRDLHWRTTARRAQPIVREYDRDQGDTWWLVLDLNSPDEAAGEAAIELAASVAAAAAGRSLRFGFAAGRTVLPPPAGGGTQLDAVLDVLAQVELGGHELPLPAPAGDCLLVTARAGFGAGFGSVLTPMPGAGAS